MFLVQNPGVFSVHFRIFQDTPISNKKLNSLVILQLNFNSTLSYTNAIYFFCRFPSPRAGGAFPETQK